jgi:nucleoside-diphosphate-sugar epimerase
MRILRGEHRIPGDGSRSLSRIHVDDLAALLLASVKVRGETFVVADLAPERHIDLACYICTTYGVPLPPSEDIERVHRTLRADRRVDACRALAALGVELRYPSYREGMSRAATKL